MSFSVEQLAQLNEEFERVRRLLQDLKLRVVAEGQAQDAGSRLREHLLHGAGRRLGVLLRAIENVFALFPPSTTKPLSSDALADVQINLHAFVLNSFGIYDNWAWAYVLRHDLEAVIGDPRRIGLFQDATRRKLPQPLQKYLAAPATIEWRQRYAKSFRDALAHRIPPYVPPAQFTSEEGERYRALEHEEVTCIKGQQWERLEAIQAEKDAIGTPCFVFLHAYTESAAARPMLLHPQMLSDAMTVAEFGDMFLTHWEAAP